VLTAIVTTATGWETLDLLPGAHVAVLADDVTVGVKGRLLGLELRDSLLVLRPGPVAGFVFLFRKPLVQSTVVGQVLATRTGALHLDACRVSADLSEFYSKTGKPRSGMGHAHGYGMGDGFGGDKANPPHTAGRWPPNVVLVHAPGCKRTGTKNVKSSTLLTKHELAESENNCMSGKNYARNPRRDYAPEGTETVAAWECELGCPVQILDEQSEAMGMHLAGNKRPMDHQKGNKVYGHFNPQSNNPDYYADTGGASRFFPQFKDESELLGWLTRLVTPV
jgi:hypothetical protein